MNRQRTIHQVSERLAMLTGQPINSVAMPSPLLDVLADWPEAWCFIGANIAGPSDPAACRSMATGIVADVLTAERQNDAAAILDRLPESVLCGLSRVVALLWRAATIERRNEPRAHRLLSDTELVTMLADVMREPETVEI